VRSQAKRGPIELSIRNDDEHHPKAHRAAINHYRRSRTAHRQGLCHGHHDISEIAQASPDLAMWLDIMYDLGIKADAAPHHKATLSHSANIHLPAVALHQDTSCILQSSSIGRRPHWQAQHAGPEVPGAHRQHAHCHRGASQTRSHLADGPIASYRYDQIVSVLRRLARQRCGMPMPFGLAQRYLPAAVLQIPGHAPEIVFHVTLAGHRVPDEQRLHDSECSHSARSCPFDSGLYLANMLTP